MNISSHSLVAVLLLTGVMAAGCSQQQTAPIDVGTAEVPAAQPYVEEQVQVQERVVVQPPVVRPIPAPVVVRPHPPINRPAPARPKPIIPPVKAKGNYRGRVQIDPNLSNHYQY